MKRAHRLGRGGSSISGSGLYRDMARNYHKPRENVLKGHFHEPQYWHIVHQSFRSLFTTFPRGKLSPVAHFRAFRAGTSFLHCLRAAFVRRVRILRLREVFLKSVQYTADIYKRDPNITVLYSVISIDYGRSFGWNFKSYIGARQVSSDKTPSRSRQKTVSPLTDLSN